MSTLSVSSITGVTNVTGSIFDAMGTTANNANATAIAAFAKANAANISAGAAFDAANAANSTATSAGVPTGGIIYWAGANAPSGFLPCDGNIYTRSTYSSLASVLGTPPMPSSYTLEYANTTAMSSYVNNGAMGAPVMASANGMLFLSITQASIATAANGQASGNLYTSTDGTTWTPRTASRMGAPFAYSWRGGSAGYTNPNMRIKNNLYAASNGASGPYVVIVGYGGYSNTIQYQTSTDQGATWTLRSREYYRPNTSFGIYPSGVVAGGTANAYLMGAGINYYGGCCGTTYWQSESNVAWSADGITFSAFKTMALFQGNTTVVPQTVVVPIIAATSNGFIAMLGGDGTFANQAWSNSSTIFWSANGHPSTWTDITANLKTTVGMTSSAQTGPFFINVFSCNNEFIIPTSTNKFLVSSNGANGTWRSVKYDGGFGIQDTYDTNVYFLSYFNPSNYAIANFRDATPGSTSYIVHNGDVILFQTSAGIIWYSKDLRTWFRKEDQNIPTNYNTSVLGRTYAGYLNTLPSLKKVLMTNHAFAGIFSFTTNGAYTAATQFPVPEIGADLAVAKSFNTSWVPLKAYIKT